MQRKIGVIDSGIGGLTVVKELQKLLPNEELIYFGDNKNVPYGNKSEEEIRYLTGNILEFMEKREVKVVALACNTISTVFNEVNQFSFPIIDIVTPTTHDLKNMDVDNLGIIGTEATIKSNMYQDLLKNGKYKITTEPSKDLASIIDRGMFDSQEIRETIKSHMDNINKIGDIYNLVLACTHYPIVDDIFKEFYPQINYINPGFKQAEAIKEYLSKNNLLNPQGNGHIEIITSGDIEIYEKVVEKLGIRNISQISTVSLV